MIRALSLLLPKHKSFEIFCLCVCVFQKMRQAVDLSLSLSLSVSFSVRTMSPSRSASRCLLCVWKKDRANVPETEKGKGPSKRCGAGLIIDNRLRCVGVLVCVCRDMPCLFFRERTTLEINAKRKQYIEWPCPHVLTFVWHSGVIITVQKRLS